MERRSSAGDVHRMVQRVAKIARIPQHISSHSLRSRIQQRRGRRPPLRDTEILARRADPRTNEQYDSARGNLNRHGVHFVTVHVALVGPGYDASLYRRGSDGSDGP